MRQAAVSIRGSCQETPEAQLNWLPRDDLGPGIAEIQVIRRRSDLYMHAPVNSGVHCEAPVTHLDGEFASGRPDPIWGSGTTPQTAAFNELPRCQHREADRQIARALY